MTLQVEALPEYRYDEGTEVRLLRGGAWIRCTLDAPHKSLANVYSAVVGGAAEEAVELTSRNHAPLLDVTMDLASEYLKYGGWIRSTYSFVVDALSGERLDIMLQCVKLKVDGSGERSDAFEVVMREVCSEVEDARPVLVIGEAASGKSTFARLFLVMCIQRQQLGLVPFLIPTIDLVRLIKQNDLTADYLDGYLRAVYGPSARRYLFLKQAMLERRLVLFLDGMDEVPTGLKSVIEAYIMTAMRMSARIVMTSRPGGFSPAWIGQCIPMRILPLDAGQQENVARARLVTSSQRHLFKHLMARPDLQQLASNPLILSMVLSYIRTNSAAAAAVWRAPAAFLLAPLAAPPLWASCPAPCPWLGC